MKEFTDNQVDDILKLKFGKIVTSIDHTSYVSNHILGKIFGVSTFKIRQLYMARFEAIKRQNMTFAEKMQLAQTEQPRKNYGPRFLKPHEIEWLISSNTLRKQHGLSLVDRVKEFKK